MPGKVYLSGPIAGLSYNGATSWRSMVRGMLANHNIQALDPMRGKEYLWGKQVLEACDGDESHLMSTPRAITTRDRWDCMRADVVLVNLLQADQLSRLSLGTIMEVAWADAQRIPIVCVRKDDTYNHPMFNDVIGFECRDLPDAVDLIREMLA